MSRLVLVLGGIAVLAIAGVAFAAGGGNSGGVTLCVAKSGEVAFGSKQGRCGKGTRKLVVAKRGPAGDAGAPGAPGPAGPAGKALDPSSEPLRLVVQNTQGCAQQPGTFCGEAGALGTWGNLSGSPVGFRVDPAGWVHLSGSVMGSESGATQLEDIAAIFYLPPGYRPTDGFHRFYTTRSSCHNAGGMSYVDVLPNGAVKPELPSGCLGLNTVVFHR